MGKTDHLCREFVSLVYGDFLGEGIARKVYACMLNTGYVIKVEEGARCFQNIEEWEIWSWVKGTPLQKWFAPCVMISACGTLLIQTRVSPLRDKELPPRLPAFMCDLKRENFGLLDGKIVCCDYGTLMCRIDKVPRKLVKAKWR